MADPNVPEGFIPVEQAQASQGPPEGFVPVEAPQEPPLGFVPVDQPDPTPVDTWGMFQQPATPDPPPNAGPQGIADLGKQALGGVYGAANAATQLFGNTAQLIREHGDDVLNPLSGVLKDMTGVQRPIESSETLRAVEDDMRRREAQGQRTIQEIGPPQSPAENIARQATEAILRIPEFATFAKAGGNVGGMAAHGALSEADKGLEAAAGGAVPEMAFGLGAEALGPAIGKAREWLARRGQPKVTPEEDAAIMRALRGEPNKPATLDENLAKRQADVEMGYGAASAEQQAAERANTESARNWFTSKLHDKYSSIYRRKGSDDAVKAVEEMQLVGSQNEVYMGRVYREVVEPLKKLGLTDGEIGQMMEYKRVLKDLAPRGIEGPVRPGVSALSLRKMHRDMGQSQNGRSVYGQAEELLRRYHQIRQDEIIPLAREAQLFSPDELALIEKNPHYARFENLDHILEESGIKIHRMKGSTGRIGNPFVHTALQDLAIARAAGRAKALQETTKMLGNLGELKPAVKSPGGKFSQPTEPGMGLVKFLHKGEQVGFYVPKDIAQSFEHNPLLTSRVARMVNIATDIPRSAYTGRNPYFWLKNTPKDIRRTMQNLPGGPIQMLRIVPEMFKAMPEAFKSVFRDPGPLVQQMLRERAMLPSHLKTVGSGQELDEATRLLLQHGFGEAPKRGAMAEGIKKGWNALGDVGLATSRMTKIGGYNYLKKYYPEIPANQRAQMVRNMVGDPSYYRKGEWNGLVNNIFLFANANKEGFRGAIEAAKHSKARAGGKFWRSDYARKFMLYTMAPKLLMWGGKAGLLGLAAKRMYDKIPEYHLTNEFVVPLYTQENGRPVYLSFPMDHMEQLAGGLTWKALQATTDDPSSSPIDIAAFPGTQAPGLNPNIGVPLDLYQVFFEDILPYDSFKGKFIFPKTYFDAGGYEKYGEALRYFFNQYSPIKIAPSDFPEQQAKTTVEKILDIPVIGDAVGKFLHVSDAGESEDYRAIIEKAESERAGKSIVRRRLAARHMENGGYTLEGVAALAQDLVKTGAVNPYTYRESDLKRLARNTMTLAEGNPFKRALMEANSNDAKAAVMDEFIKRHNIPPHMWADVFEPLIEAGHISDKAAAQGAYMALERIKPKGQSITKGFVPVQ